jgi:hypothetical protein
LKKDEPEEGNGRNGSASVSLTILKESKIEIEQGYNFRLDVPHERR